VERVIAGCARCGRRRVDPVAGPSDWRRGVLSGEQVLVCPQCQVPGWSDALDRCATCGSTRLAKRLGEVSCGACGSVDSAVAGEGFADAVTADPQALGDDVEAALGRLLGRD
jgi:hypothetical protein